MSTKKEIYTTAEVAKQFRISTATVRRLVKDRKLKPIKGFKQPFRFSGQELQRFVYGRKAA